MQRHPSHSHPHQAKNHSRHRPYPLTRQPLHWPSKGLWFALLVWSATQWHCLERAERLCEENISCRGSALPSVCFAGRCLPQVCEPGKRQSCYEALCDAKNTPCPKTLRGVGGCLDGYQLCVDNGSRWSRCFASTPPTPEICDGQDNNCDGQIDENLDCTCQIGQSRACYTGAPQDLKSSNSLCANGVQLCIANAQQKPSWGACRHQRRPIDLPADAIEACQLRDIDCDGQIDETGADCRCTKEGETRSCYAGPPSTAGVGPCQAGTQTCKMSPEKTLSWTRCVDQVLPSPEELSECDGIDNDCDGKVDHMTGQNIPYYRHCGDSKDCNVQVCLQKTWGLCTSQEICANQQDENCDGMIDEQPCQATP